MSSTKEHIKVFIAYISDVKKEVAKCKAIQELINREIASLNLYLEINTWEDVPESFGRPQEIINKEFVENCDIFIGVLGKRWGTPTGKFDCGFEEEFNIAETRYKQRQEPEILLYTKEVDETNLNDDEKKEYEKVKQFIKDIKENKKGLIVPFNNTNKLQNYISTRLRRYLNDYSTKKPPIQQINQSTRHVTTATAKKSHRTIQSAKQESQSKAHLRKLIEDVHLSVNKGSFKEFEDKQKARLFLLSSAILYSDRSYGILGNHEIHKIYFYRKSINFKNFVS